MNEIRHVANDGLQLAVEALGNGLPLIFGHGLTGNRYFTRMQVGNLADRYQVIIFDQRGHCDSTPVTDPALYDPRLMAGDMAVILDALEVDTAVIGGESMGSAVAVSFALQWPGRVEKLLLTAPAFGDTPNAVAPEIALMADAVEALGMDGFLAAAKERQLNELGWPPEMVDFMQKMHGSHDGRSFATACRAVMAWTPFVDLTELQALTMPTCIIAWEGDPLHPYTLAERYAAEIPDARLERLPSMMDLFVNPGRIGEIYGRFLAE